MKGLEHIQGKLFDRKLAAGILHYARKYTMQLSLALVLVLALVGISLCLPLIMKTVIDELLSPASSISSAKRMDKLVTLSGLYALVSLVIFGGRFLETYLLSWVGQKTVFDIRSDLFKKALSLPLRYFDQHPVGSLMTRVGSDVEAIEKAVTQGLVPLAADLLGFFGILFFMFWLSPALTMACLALLPLMVLVVVLLNLAIRRSHRLVRKSESALNSFSQEMISGMQTVQLFNRQGATVRSFREHSHTLEKAHLKAVTSMSSFFPSIEILSAANLVVILVAGSWMILHGKGGVTIGVLVAFVMYMKDLFRPIEGLSERMSIFQSALASSERVFHLLQREPEIQEPENPVPVTRFKGLLEFDHVSFAYEEDNQVLEDIDFTVQPGQMVALVGATGSGKTTIVHLLARFYDVQQGQIRVDENDIRSISLDTLRRNIGIVTQEPNIFSGTFAENISLGRNDLSDRDIQEAASFVNAHVFIRTFPEGMNTRIGKGGVELSTGQKQLLALARAFAQNPDILLVLDEATSNVDTQTEHLIQKALKKLMANRTSIVIAHRLSTIRNADLLLVMRQGQIVERGTHSELVKADGYYSDLYRLMMKSMPGEGNNG